MTDPHTLNVGLLQAQLTWREPAENRAHLESFLDDHLCEAHVVVMPETFTTGFLGDAGTADEGMDGPTVEWMTRLADRHGCAITGSAVITLEQGRVNRLLWVTPGGGIDFYDKKHLFSYVGEDKRYVAGNEQVIIEYRGWRICPQICYDIRFPAWCRNRGNYDLLLAVANWPKPRIDAWSALLKARAIENQAFVVAVNRVGADGNGTHYPGHSVVHGPLGGTVVRLDAAEQYVEVQIDLARVREVRAELPFQADADRFEFSG